MNAVTRALTAGLIGSACTNLLHEFGRRTARESPRVDLLGMQAFAKTAGWLGLTSPTGRRLYAATLAADLASNAAYFAFAGFASPRSTVAAGAALGLAAGFGAVVLPPKLKLSGELTARSPVRALTTCAFYFAGGLAAGAALRGFRGAD